MFPVKSDDEVSADCSSPSFSSGEGQEEISLAHLSDLHLSSLHEVRFRDLLNKRILGYLSWFAKRRHVHLPEVLTALLTDMRLQRIDHTVITGDLTHLGLPFEYREALEWLEQLGDAGQVTVIPGNHDAYWPTSWDNTLALWEPFMASDSPFDSKDLFPSLRIRGGLALIGLSTARPSGPFLAVGSLGRKQQERLEEILARTGQKGLLRIILLHHPPVRESINWRKRLTDQGPFARVLARQGAELVLHGHAHRPLAGELPGPAGPIPVLGVPSASEIANGSSRGAKYHIYRFSRRAERWEVDVFVRAYLPENGIFIPEKEFRLNLPGFGS